jgi:hypothetical protein
MHFPLPLFIFFYSYIIPNLFNWALSRYFRPKGDNFSNEVLLHTLMSPFSALSGFLDSSEWTISSADFLGRWGCVRTW